MAGIFSCCASLGSSLCVAHTLSLSTVFVRGCKQLSNFQAAPE